MAAISTSIMANVKTGDHIIFQNDLYGGTTIEVKARKSGEGFTQLDKWKGSADLLIFVLTYHFANRHKKK